MPIFEVEHNGQVYEVDAPDIQQAATAAQAFSAAAPPVNTTDEYVTGPAGQRMLNPDRVPMPADDPNREPTAPTAPTDQGVLSQIWDAIVDNPVLEAVGNDLLGAPETIATIVNNAGVDVAGGLGGIGDMLANPLSPERWTDSLNYMRDNYSYTPQGSEARNITEGLGEALAPVANLKQAMGEGVLDLTGSPELAFLADMAPDIGLTLLGGQGGVPKGPARVPGQAPSVLAAEVTPPRTLLGDDLAGGQVPGLDANDPVVRARRAGYKVLPSDAERIEVDVPGKKREKLLPTDSRRDLTLANQKNTNRLAREEIGVPADTRLDEKAFSAVKQPHFATYKQAESIAKRGPLSEKFQALLDKAQAAVSKTDEKLGITETIGGLRSEARRFAESTDVKTVHYADELLDLADAIEAEFGAHLKAVGEPKMLKAYQDARQALAKINDVEQAERGGQINADIIRKRGNKGSKLSGRLKMIAETAADFGDATRASTSSAGRAAQVEPSIYRSAKDLVTAGVRKIPGLGDQLDVLSEGFQNKLGRVATPEEESYFATYGRYPDIPERKLPDMPTRQQDMLGEAFEFETPEGQVGRLPPKPMPTEQVEGLGTALDLERPPGNAPANPKRDITQQTEEFQPMLDLESPPGKVGKPKGSIDVRTGVKGAKSKTQIDELTDLTPEEIEYLRSILGD